MQHSASCHLTEYHFLFLQKAALFYPCMGLHGMAAPQFVQSMDISFFILDFCSYEQQCSESPYKTRLYTCACTNVDLSPRRGTAMSPLVYIFNFCDHFPLFSIGLALIYNPLNKGSIILSIFLPNMDYHTFLF